MLILLSDLFDPAMKERLLKFGEVTDNPDTLSEADVIVMRSTTKCGREFIDKAVKLKYIIRAGIGTDNVDVSYAGIKGIRVFNTPKASIYAVAELAFAMMLAVSCRLVEAHNSMAEGKWIKKELSRNELYGKTLCLIGMGNIASEVAKRAAAFGMKVVAYRRQAKKSPYAEVLSEIKSAVKDADYISIHLPWNKETERIFDEKIIDACLRKPAVINTGRAQCIDEHAMLKALEDGRISYYASDVWPSDPPPENYPLLKAPNTLMTPHIGASSRENLLRAVDEVEDIFKKLKFSGEI